MNIGCISLLVDVLVNLEWMIIFKIFECRYFQQSKIKMFVIVVVGQYSFGGFYKQNKKERRRFQLARNSCYLYIGMLGEL